MITDEPYKAWNEDGRMEKKQALVGLFKEDSK